MEKKEIQDRLIPVCAQIEIPATTKQLYDVLNKQSEMRKLVQRKLAEELVNRLLEDGLIEFNETYVEPNKILYGALLLVCKRTEE